MACVLPPYLALCPPVRSRNSPRWPRLQVLFVVYLMHPKFDGAIAIYDSAIQPFLARNEETIDELTYRVHSDGSRLVAATARQIWTMATTGADGLLTAMRSQEAGEHVDGRGRGAQERQGRGGYGSDGMRAAGGTFNRTGAGAVASAANAGGVRASYTFGQKAEQRRGIGTRVQGWEGGE